MKLSTHPIKNATTLAAVAWVLNVQYFVVQLIVGATSTVPFSLTNNTISDLGNTVCGQYGSRLVCSPNHDLMNASFVIVGLTIIIGGVLFARSSKNTWARCGFIGLVLSGIGTIVVGLFPENSPGNYHALGASLPFVVGNISLIILGLSLRLGKLSFWITTGVGLLSLVALILFMTHRYGPLGHGGMERIVAYPQTIWMIYYGVRQLKIRQKT